MRKVPSRARSADRPRTDRPAPGKKFRLRMMALEGLEARRLMAALPVPFVNGQINIGQADGAQGAGNQNTPSVAIDPTNPLKLVATWVRHDPAHPFAGTNGQTTTYIEGAFSIDGGQTWGALGIGPAINAMIDVGRAQNVAGAPFYLPTVTDASVAFGPGDQVYVTSMAHNDADLTGAITLQKFDFSGAAPTPGITSTVYQWSGTNPAYKPTLAVDDNRASYTDTNAVSGRTNTQTDPYVGDVYVAWSTNSNTANTPAGTTPNVIELAGSGNGGASFSTPIPVDSTGNNSTARDSAPQIAISQGSPTVPGGQVTVIWDDSGTLSTATPPMDRIVANRIQDGVATAAFTGSGGAIPQATTNGSGVPNTPSVTSFPLAVNISNPNFTAVSDLSVTVNLLHGYLSEVSIDLVAPNGTTIRLLNNKITAAGATLNTGITGTNLGQSVSGQNLGTTFDSNAPQTISEYGAPAVASFAPDGGSLAAFNGPVSSANGTWQLVVTDYGNHTTPPTQALLNWSLNFTSGLSLATGAAGANSVVGKTAVLGAVANNAYPLVLPVAPDVGIGPGAVIASDNTLGAYSPYQGRLYVAYTEITKGALGITLSISNDGGLTWSPLNTPVNPDVPTQDGFSGQDRPQFMPAITVDQSTGTVVLSDFDTRNDAAMARVATYVGASIDGGLSFSPMTFANAPDEAQDAVKLAGGEFNNQIVRGPIPDNQSSGNPLRDTTYGFGTHQAIVAFGGQVYPVWASNLNGGPTGTQNLSITTARVLIAAGPRAISSTMGPIGGANDTLNTGRAADGTPILSDIQVVFDRPVDPSTFTPAQFQLYYMAAVVGATPVPAPTGFVITALDPTPFGATTFDVKLTNPQSNVGTYSYAVGPAIRSDIKSPVNSVGVLMDQNANAVPGEDPGDIYAVPRPINGPSGGPPVGPYDQNTLPIIIPGPVVVASYAQHADGSAPTPEGSPVTDSAVNGVIVIFDRNMDPTSFTSAAVTRVMGPAGLISGPFTVTADPAADPGNPQRAMLISFPVAQVLSGTYIVTFGPGLKDVRGEALDQNQNAGLYLLDPQRNPSGATEQVTYQATTATPQAPAAGTTGPLPQAIPAATSAGPGILTSTINVTDPTLIQGLTVQLNITDSYDPNLGVVLTAPNGAAVTLFSGVGLANANNHQNFVDTLFSDNAQTPIQNGGAPFFGTFNPKQALATIASPTQEISPAGVWTLTIIDTGTANIGTLNGWTLNLTKKVPATGLGEAVADLATASFRIFAMDPTDALASSVWTAVGPASIGGSPGANNGPEDGGGGARSGRIGGIAVDPSDPSGNTVYIGGASGGIWKTTDFLNPSGPTYIPLTNFGPTFAINIGGIAVFPRNNDPNQSIVFAVTGEGDTGSPGVGVLRSMDGGATWTLLDSTNNNLPFASRDHAFAGTSSFKIVVDPNLTPSGQVVVYMALTGAHGGIWRSVDSGQTWGVVNPATGQRTANLPGNATDLVLDPSSATGGGGNLQGVYAAIEGQGVFYSTNEGQTFNQVLGGVGDPLFQDSVTSKPIPVGAPAGTPNGGFGRLLLAKPFLTGNAAEDLIYQGWLYAAAMTTGGTFQGLYVTKDFGQNWTQIAIPNVQVPPPSSGAAATNPAIPTNDTTQPNYNVGGGNASQGVGAQGNYDFSFAIDPTNPNVLYMGGTADGQATGFIRIDATGINDPHALVPYNNRAPDGGLLEATTNNSTGLLAPAVKLQKPADGVGLASFGTPPDQTPNQPLFNLIRDPYNPFVADATQYVGNAAQFNNTAAVARWVPFDLGGTDQHRIVTFVDPLTGHARLIIGDDQGVWTGVDNNGAFDPGIGTAPFTGVGSATDPTAGDRNGNLQITQFYYGAVQPSTLNTFNQIQSDLFIGSAQDNGGPMSPGGILSPGNPDYGNITWSGPGGDAVGVATDQQGVGTLYQYWWPCCGGNGTDFFQVNGTGRTFGLLQQSLPSITPDPQWPAEGGSNFAVNPLTGQQVAMSSQAGRVFLTENQGLTWSVIGNPTALDGSYAPAIAFGAPDPNSPDGIGNLDNFIYVGTSGGHIFVTTTGGGGGGASGNNWANISAGLDGSTVQAIVTDPTRGSHIAYAVTSNGVYFNPDTVATPTVPAAAWINISGTTPAGITGDIAAGNIFQLTHHPFGDPTIRSALLAPGGLTSIVADWRYVIPENPANPNSPTFPILYAGGQGGVFRSVDNGQTWTPFPTSAAISPSATGITTPAMGYLPVSAVTDLQTALGAIDPTTGRPQPKAGDPNVLTASTYGTGFYSIRLAPVVFTDTATQPNLLTLGILNTSTGAVTPVAAGSIIATTSLVVNGFSEQTAFGNVVTVNLLDETPGDSTFGQVVGTALTDASGHFAVDLTNAAFGAPGNGSTTGDGAKTLGVQATDASQTAGNLVTFNFTLQRAAVVPLPPPTLDPASDSGVTGETQYLRFTNDTAPAFDVSQALAGPATVELLRKVHNPGAPNDTNLADYTVVATVTGGATNGAPLTIRDPGPLADGTYDYAVLQFGAGGTPAPSISTPALVVTIDTVAPPRASAPILAPASITGPAGTNETNINQPVLTGTLPADPNAPADEPAPLVQIVEASSLGTYTVLGAAQAVPQSGGGYTYAVQLASPLADGTYTLLARAQDAAGNLGPVSTGGPNNNGGVIVTIITAKPPAATLVLDPVEVQTGEATALPASPSLQDPQITRINQPLFFGNAAAGLVVDLVELKATLPDPTNLLDPNNFIVLQANVPVPNNGQVLAPYSLMPAAPLADGVYPLYVRTRDAVGNASLSNPLDLQVKTQGPTVAPTLALAPTSDTGLKGDNITSDRRPVFTGHAEPYALVDLVNLALPNGPAQASTQADASGNFSIQLPSDLGNGRIALAAREHDVVNNPGPLGAPLVLSIVTTAGDYFGTGSADLAVYNQANATFNIVGPTATRSLQFGDPQVDIPIGGDFNGDGKVDFVTFRPTNAYWSIAYSSGAAAIVPFGTPGGIPVPGNYDGPGKEDLATYDPSNGHWSIFSFNTGQTYNVYFSFGPNDIPVPGDYFGTGQTDLAVYRPSTGQFVVLNTNAKPGTSALVTFTIPGAKPGDVPLKGDFFGDGRQDPAVYRPSTGTWIILRTANGGVDTIPSFGGPGAVPVPLDYNGDGYTDVAIYQRPVGTNIVGTWAILDYAGRGSFRTQQFIGSNYDLAIYAPEPLRTPRAPALAPSTSTFLRAASVAATPLTTGTGTGLNLGHLSLKLATVTRSARPAIATPAAAVLQAAAAPTRSRPAQVQGQSIGLLHDAALDLFDRF